ncbi:hypothetical protein ABT262_32605, partial [Amycolatopsis mediterranei]
MWRASHPAGRAGTRGRPGTTSTSTPIRGWRYGIATNLLRNHVRQEVRGFQLTAKAGAEDRPPKTTT